MTPCSDTSKFKACCHLNIVPETMNSSVLIKRAQAYSLESSKIHRERERKRWRFITGEHLVHMSIYWSYTFEPLTSSWANHWSLAPPNPLSRQCYCRHTAAEWTQWPFTHIQWAMHYQYTNIDFHSRKKDQDFRLNLFSNLRSLLQYINPTSYAR